MEQITYERPREKLRNRGVTFLTLVELIQLIIGSGGAKVSGAKLAKNIGAQLSQGTTTYDALITINGLGPAKVCQLLAAIELSNRLNSTLSKPAISKQRIAAYRSHVRAHPTQLLCIWTNGSGAEVDMKFYQLKKSEHHTIVTKHLLADAMAVRAHGVLLIADSKRLNSMGDTYKIGLVGALKDGASLLGIQVQDVLSISTTKIESLKGLV